MILFKWHHWNFWLRILIVTIALILCQPTTARICRIRLVSSIPILCQNSSPIGIHGVFEPLRLAENITSNINILSLFSRLSDLAVNLTACENQVLLSEVENRTELAEAFSHCATSTFQTASELRRWGISANRLQQDLTANLGMILEELDPHTRKTTLVRIFKDMFRNQEAKQQRIAWLRLFDDLLDDARLLRLSGHHLLQVFSDLGKEMSGFRRQINTVFLNTRNLYSDHKKSYLQWSKKAHIASLEDQLTFLKDSLKFTNSAEKSITFINEPLDAMMDEVQALKDKMEKYPNAVTDIWIGPHKWKTDLLLFVGKLIESQKAYTTTER